MGLGPNAIARVCHEANRAYCMTHGDKTQVGWDQAPDAVKDSALAGVLYRIENPGATPAEQHEKWVDSKVADGWTHGPRKDIAKKQHPNICAYEELPERQQIKDKLFQAIVDALHE